MDLLKGHQHENKFASFLICNESLMTDSNRPEAAAWMRLRNQGRFIVQMLCCADVAQIAASVSFRGCVDLILMRLAHALRMSSKLCAQTVMSGGDLRDRSCCDTRTLTC